MAWIDTVPKEDAKGLVKRYYEASLKRTISGNVSESLKIYSINENHLRAASTLRASVMEDPSGINRVQRQSIAVRVSTLNGCDH